MKRHTNSDSGLPVVKEENSTFKNKSGFEGTFVIDCQEPMDIR